MLLLNKKIGETPLEVLENYKTQNPEFRNAKLAYAGRLDPMASGLLVVLVGDECKMRDRFQNLDKTYQFDLVLGIETDTYDVMGLINPKYKIQNPKVGMKKTEMERIILDFEGEIEQEYPPFSSFHINGKPLWHWNKIQNSNNEVPIFVAPKKKVKIYKLEILSTREVLLSQFIDKAIEKIKLVKGNFRQEEIINNWKKLKIKNFDCKINIIKIKSHVSSGTYIRSLAREMGIRLGTKALADNIYRSKIGEYSLD